MGLVVACNTTAHELTGQRFTRSWLVEMRLDGKKYAAAWGFARRRDAEIALEVLNTKTGIDWNADEKTIRAQLNAFGGREAIKKLVAEHLQW